MGRKLCDRGKNLLRLYRADEETGREHARRGGFPANRVSEVKTIIDPTTAEAAADKSAG
jgi:hypothetical protein